MPVNLHTTSRVQVLTVNAEPRDQVTLSQIFGHTSWSIDRAETVGGAATVLAKDTCPVVLCDERLPDGDWKDIFALTQTLPVPPQVIVFSRSADDRLWSEVLNYGGYDVLAKPFQTEEVLHAIGSAWRHWMDRRRVKNGSAVETALHFHSVA